MRKAYIELPPGVYTESDVLVFIGWLCADTPELHTVEVTKLTESWERFKAKSNLVSHTGAEHDT